MLPSFGTNSICYILAGFDVKGLFTWKVLDVELYMVVENPDWYCKVVKWYIVLWITYWLNVSAHFNDVRIKYMCQTNVIQKPRISRYIIFVELNEINHFVYCDKLSVYIFNAFEINRLQAGVVVFLFFLSIQNGVLVIKLWKN